MTSMNNIVLVHGGFMDGAGWEGVYKILKKQGYNVSIVPPQDGFLFLDKKAFPASFAGDVDPEKAAFMADSQVPWGVEAFSGSVSEPAWRTKPSWYLVVTEDKTIPPGAQRAMSKRAGAKVVEVKGSHAIYVSQPKVVADLIEEAAKAKLKVKAA
jgi:pimeloyl-ACP methyl ester carboxylesterase